MSSLLSYDLAQRFATEPRSFLRFYWPNMILYQKQVEIMESVRDNYSTFCHAGHKLGKDRIAALTALWFFCTRRPARVIISSSSQTQLKDTLWGEFTNLIHEAANIGRVLPLHVQSLHLQKPIPGKDNEFFPLDYVRGIVAAKGESFHGHHLDSSVMPRVLIILSESSGIEDVHWDASQTQAHRILVTGNPVMARGFFHEQCKKGDERHPMGKGLLRKVIHIDGERDSPNVIAGKQWAAAGGTGEPPNIIPGVLSYEEFLIRKTWPPDQRRMRLHGLFLDEAADYLFPTDHLQVAERLGEMLRVKQDDGTWELRKDLRYGTKALGVDVGAGRDWTVWTIVCRWGVLYKRRKQTRNTSTIAGITLRIMDRYDISPENVAFDAGGGGLQIAQRMEDDGYRGIMSVAFNGVSNEPREYRNLRSEMYGETAKLMSVSYDETADQPTPTATILAMLSKDPSNWMRHWVYMSIPPGDTILKEDLAVLPRLYDAEGRIRLPPKDRDRGGRHTTSERSIREMLGRSPDDADSLVLAVYAFRLGLEMDHYERRRMAY